MKLISPFTARFGQGYLVFGTEKGASVRDTVTVTESGTYLLDIKYSLGNSDISGLALYVNGRKAESLSLYKTGSTSDWEYYSTEIKLKKGENTVELWAVNELDDALYLDCIIIEGEAVSLSSPAVIYIVIAVLLAVIIIAVIAVITVIKKKKA